MAYTLTDARLAMIRRESRASGYDLLLIDGRSDSFAFAETGKEIWNLVVLGKFVGTDMGLEKVSEILSRLESLKNISGHCAP